MAILRCKMCGGQLSPEPDATSVECEYCGVKQTIPVQDDEKKLSLFVRADKLLAKCDFDKAAAIYESIVAEYPDEAESYWDLVLCKYGIEYVDDHATGKKIPTCHRTSYESVLEDDNFEQACENADMRNRLIYRDRAKELERIRQRILEVSEKEEPYDIFICYKETDETGDRTVDSVLAQNVYNLLTEKGYRVFFSRISLEDKLGLEYEPYIFAALSRARIMLAFGSSYEYYQSVWVKNEWSRYLKLMAQDHDKHLIPCYKNLDPYDIPKEFSHLQAQDMGKVGAEQDLLRGIEKLLPLDSTDGTTVVQQVSGNAASLLERGFMALEDGEKEKAEGFFEEVLNLNAHCGEAYWGKLLLEQDCRKAEDFLPHILKAEDNRNYQRACQFASPKLKKLLRELKGKAEAQRAEALRQSAIRCRQRRAELQPAQGLLTAAHHFSAAVDLAGDISCTVPDQDRWYSSTRNITDAYAIRIAAGENHIAALHQDGTVEVYQAVEEDSPKNYPGKQLPDTTQWKQITAIASGEYHVVGLREDGTVVAAGDNEYGQCEVSGWSGVTAVDAGSYFTAGLREDGTVVVTDMVGELPSNVNPDLSAVSSWKHVTAIAAGYYTLLGLLENGTVVRVCCRTDLDFPDLSEWTDMVEITVGYGFAAGLKVDGTVWMADTYSGYHRKPVWENIWTIAAGCFQLLGMDEDGRVLATGSSDYHVDRVDEWPYLLFSWYEFEHLPISDEMMNQFIDDGTAGKRSLFGMTCVDLSNMDDVRKSEMEAWRKSREEQLRQEAEEAEAERRREAEEAEAKRRQEKEEAQRKAAEAAELERKRKEEQARLEAARRKALEEAQRLAEEQRRAQQLQADRRAKGLCQHCGGTFKGLFTRKCASCGKPKDY